MNSSHLFSDRWAPVQFKKNEKESSSTALILNNFAILHCNLIIF